jgi:pimeloyl-ACP methyl ester carboxylesterase
MQLEIIRRRPETPADTGGPAHKPPLLCIHGAYHAAWCWEEHFLSYFAAVGYDAAAVSLRGHGGSPGRKRISEWRLADYLDDVLQAADLFDRPPVLLGHSLGGVLALMYLARREAPAAVLLAPGAVGCMRQDALRWLVRHPWASLTSFLTRDMRRLLPTFRPHFFSPETPPDAAHRFMGCMQEESYHVVTDQARLAPPVLKDPATPLLLVRGELDSIPRRQHEAMARRYGADLKSFPLGHELMLEPRWRSVADSIAAWLGEHGR